MNTGQKTPFSRPFWRGGNQAPADHGLVDAAEENVVQLVGNLLFGGAVAEGGEGERLHGLLQGGLHRSAEAVLHQGANGRYGCLVCLGEYGHGNFPRPGIAEELQKGQTVPAAALAPEKRPGSVQQDFPLPAPGEPVQQRPGLPEPLRQGPLLPEAEAAVEIEPVPVPVAEGFQGGLPVGEPVIGAQKPVGEGGEGVVLLIDDREVVKRPEGWSRATATASRL